MVIISVTLARGQCWGHGHFKYPITLRFSTYLNQLYPYVLKECCIRFREILIFVLYSLYLYILPSINGV